MLAYIFNMEIKVKKLNQDAKLPEYAHSFDAGMDLFSVEDLVLKKGEVKAVSCGIAMEIPDGFVGLIWDKSGLALNSGIKTMGGVVDAGYRGEIKVILINLSDSEFQIKKGQKVAQMLIQKVENCTIKEVKELSSSERDKKGFGSTGL